MNDQVQEHTTDTGDTIEIYVTDGDDYAHLGIMEDFYASTTLDTEDILWMIDALHRCLESMKTQPELHALDQSVER